MGQQLSQILTRHQQRREQMIPTVSILKGPISTSIAEWHNFTHRLNRLAAIIDQPDWDSILSAFLKNYKGRRSLVNAALKKLSRDIRMDEDDLRFHLQKKSKRDLELFLEQNLPAHSVDPSARFCHTLILESHVRVFEADTIGSLHEIINDPLLSSPMIIEILNDWEPTWTPSLILVTREENMNSLHELERYANLAGEAAERIPRFPLAWAVESQSYSRYFDYAPESRAKAICRETVCDVTPVTSSDIERRLEPLAISSTGHLYETIQRLERDGLGESLANAFIQAVASSGNPSEHETGKARSAAEAFLFARLESLPETSSVFSLNEHLDIPFGSNASMEIDLLSREHRIAIEIDGYYHFQEAQSYRCDRRKDYLIQKNGFLVLRFLAEDIVTHLETILDTILESLIDRRKENSE